MGTRLLQIISFVGVPASGTVALPHQINVNNEPQAPDFVAGDAGGFTISADAAQVIVTNNGTAPADINVWLELKHSTSRELGRGPTGLTQPSLIPRPFVAAAGGGGSGGGTSLIHVEDVQAVPLIVTNNAQEEILSCPPITANAPGDVMQITGIVQVNLTGNTLGESVDPQAILKEDGVEIARWGTTPGDINNDGVFSFRAAIPISWTFPGDGLPHTYSVDLLTDASSDGTWEVVARSIFVNSFSASTPPQPAALTFPVAALQVTDFTAAPGFIYPMDATGINIVAQLPPAAGLNGQWIGIYVQFLPGSGICVLQADGTDTIDLINNSFNVNPGLSMILVSDGISNWIQLTSIFNGGVQYGVYLPFSGVVSSNAASTLQDLRLNGRINNSGSFAGSIHPAPLPAGLTDNYSPPAMGSRNRIKQEINAAGSSLGGLDITVFGTVAVVDGEIMTITNESATATLTIVHESLTTPATSRFALPGNVNLAILPRGSKTFIYDAETTLPGFGRWVVFS